MAPEEKQAKRVAKSQELVPAPRIDEVYIKAANSLDSETDTSMAGVVTFRECECGDSASQHPCQAPGCDCLNYRFKRWNPAPPSGSTPEEVEQ